jgi:hypothetical protein
VIRLVDSMWLALFLGRMLWGSGAGEVECLAGSEDDGEVRKVAGWVRRSHPSKTAKGGAPTFRLVMERTKEKGGPPATHIQVGDGKNKRKGWATRLFTTIIPLICPSAGGTVTYFPLLYRVEREERFLIWISDDTDLVATGADGNVLSFASVDVLRSYAAEMRWTVENDDNPILHDLDFIIRWVAAPVEPVDCVQILNGWNLFKDISTSVGSPRNGVFEPLDSQSFVLYDRIFWGNNLPAVTPQGERFVPSWSPDELRAITQVLAAGLDLFTSCVRDWRYSSTHP